MARDCEVQEEEGTAGGRELERLGIGESLCRSHPFRSSSTTVILLSHAPTLHLSASTQLQTTRLGSAYLACPNQ